MGKTAQLKKRSLLKIGLGGFAVKLGKGPQNLKKAMLCTKDRFARVLEEHVERKKRKKAIRRVKELLEKRKQRQHEIDNSSQDEIRLERDITNLTAANEQHSHEAAKRKRSKKRRKQQADELPVANRAIRKSRRRSQRNTKDDDSHHVSNRKVGKKPCLKCKRRKAKSDFHKDRSCKDGLARWCKECKAKAARKYRKKQTAVKKK